VTKIELAINLKLAKTLGFKIPEPLIGRGEEMLAQAGDLGARSKLRPHPIEEAPEA
jgi:hypothetical protein